MLGLMLQTTDHLRHFLHMTDVTTQGDQHVRESNLNRAVAYFRSMWLCSAPSGDDSTASLLPRACHAQQVLSNQKDKIMSMASHLQHVGRELVQTMPWTVVDTAVMGDTDEVDFVTDLNRAWQLANPNGRGLYVHDLGIYVLATGVVVQPSAAMATPGASCSSCVLYSKANVAKPESCITSMW